jgi:hypothetical protein
MFAWPVLALVFLDELLAAAAAGVWGHHAVGLWLAVVAPIVFIVGWWSFASPKAPRGGPVTRPVVKVIAFGLASLGLWVAGHHSWAIALLAFSVIINALAQLPVVRREVDRVSSVS